MDKPGLFVPAIGDGDAETGSPAGYRLAVQQARNPRTDGIVLLIPHLNGCKRSLLP